MWSRYIILSVSERFYYVVTVERYILYVITQKKPHVIGQAPLYRAAWLTLLKHENALYQPGTAEAVTEDWQDISIRSVSRDPSIYSLSRHFSMLLWFGYWKVDRVAVIWCQSHTLVNWIQSILPYSSLTYSNESVTMCVPTDIKVAYIIVWYSTSYQIYHAVSVSFGD